MGITDQALFTFARSDFHQLRGLYEPWRAAPAPAPRLVVLNEQLAAELGTDLQTLRAPAGIAVLVGNAEPAGATPVAQAYAGHQFGGFSPRLGDGRALLLGEVVDRDGRRRDLHLKGSGPTPFARGGDGRAALGPMLREYVMGEAMHALGIPTTRALAVLTTGDRVVREVPLPGAVLVRVAASHLRVGTFEFAARHEDPTLVRRLADHAITRHFPAALESTNPYLTFYDLVIDAQASLLARWMLVGFIHGVMNTDNMAISGETIDYGPCAFMDAFDPDTVFSSIDHGGRYAYGNQPTIAQWNLARLAETLLPLFHDDVEVAVAEATSSLQTFTEHYQRYWADGLLNKLGVRTCRDVTLGADLLTLMTAQSVDFTSCFRSLASAVRGDPTAVRSLFSDPAAFDVWADRWMVEVSSQSATLEQVALAMDRVNPRYIPRNHLVEAALADAGDDDLGPLERLVDVLAAPFEERPDLEAYAGPAPAGFGPHRTFCGT